jgi:hypothetical protein
MLRLRLILAALAALFLTASPAAAWWEYGHETVARIAYLQVTPATRTAIDALLREQRLLDTPTCPARSIAEASIWPDCVKTLGDRFSYAYAWHYVDIDVCKPFDPKGPCAGGNCVIAQIERNQRLLADKTLNPRERLMALIFLVHFVGDLHQPLHAAERAGDQGGNKLILSYGAMPHTNLHAVWDGLLPDRAISIAPADAPGLLAGLTPARRATIQGGSVTDWARESWMLARDTVYPTATHGPACPPQPDAAAAGLDEAAIATLMPVVRDQLLKGGVRLAKMLDDAFAGHVPPRPRSKG